MERPVLGGGEFPVCPGIQTQHRCPLGGTGQDDAPAPSYCWHLSRTECASLSFIDIWLRFITINHISSLKSSGINSIVSLLGQESWRNLILCSRSHAACKSQVKLGIQIWQTQGPALANMFLLGFPSTPLEVCVQGRREWGGGLGGSAGLQSRKCSGQMPLIYVLTGRHSAFGCQCLIIGEVHIKIWFPTYLEKTGTLAVLACIHTWKRWLQWPRTAPSRPGPMLSAATAPVALHPAPSFSPPSTPLGDVRVLLPAWTFHMHAQHVTSSGTGKCLSRFLEGTKPQRVTGWLCLT